jgi:hypothetical protein
MILTLLKSNRKITERGKIDTFSTRDRSLSWLGTNTSIKSGGVILVLWTQASHLNEMMRSCKYIQHVSK